MGRRLLRFVALVVSVAGLGCLAFTAAALAVSGYFVTFAARQCSSYSDIFANRARNDIVESLEDLGPDSQYGDSGELVSPAFEDLPPQSNCEPLPNWTFTMGTGYVTRAVSGKWGSMSKVTSPYSTSIVTQGSASLLDNHGDPVGTQTIAGAVTVKLTDAQVAQASRPGGLWVQGGTPDDPVLANQFGSPEAPAHGFGTLRCATDNYNGDNVEYILFPSGVNHVFCYAYYVVPPPTSGTIVIRKQVMGVPAGTNPAFSFHGDLSFDPGGFTLRNGQSATFYRAGGQPWTVTEGGAADYRLDSIKCTGTASSGEPATSTTITSGSTLTINLSASETVDCTFLNTWVPPTGNLTITKITEGGVGSFDFLVASDNGSASTSVTATTSDEGVPADAGPESSLADLALGTYTLTERKPVSTSGGWHLVGVECDGISHEVDAPVKVTIVAGQHSVCTFTNRLVPAGAIALSKVTQGGVGTADFVIESTGAAVVQYRQSATTHMPGAAADAVPDTAADTTDHIDLGTYRISEQPPLSTTFGSWALTAVQCDGVDVPFSQGAVLVTLNRARPRASCRFTNTFTHAPPVDPEPGEPEEPTPPSGPTEPEGTTPQPGDVWANISVSTNPNHRLVQSGHKISDTIVVRNHGPSVAEGVILDYQAPKGTRLISLKAGLGSCSRTLPFSCRLGIVKPGQKETLTATMVSAERSGIFTMHTALGSSTYDPDMSNNSATERLYIAPPPPKRAVACPSQARPVAHIAC